MEFRLWNGKEADRCGDRILVSGIDYSGFQENPIMYFDHQRANAYLEAGESSVIGRWENLRIEDDSLYATPVFDMNDEYAAEIARKVNEGFIRACSIGFRVLEEDATIPYLVGQKSPTMTRIELLEVSIVELPAHQNAVRVKNFPRTQNIKAMEIKELLEKFDGLAKEVEKLKAENAEMKKGATTEEVEKIKAENVEFRKEIDSLKTKSNISLADLVDAVKGNAPNATEDRTNWTFFDWQNKDAEGLAKIKSTDPEKYSLITKKLR